MVISSLSPAARLEAAAAAVEAELAALPPEDDIRLTPLELDPDDPLEVADTAALTAVPTAG